MCLKSVPVIDLSRFYAGGPDEMPRLIAEVRAACESIGFFLVKGHGVDEGLLEETLKATQHFFSLPVKDKLVIQQPAGGVPRGYTPFKGETLSAGLGKAAPADLKEMIDIGPVDVPDGDYYHNQAARFYFHDNLWPPKPENFRQVMEQYYRRMNSLANDLMELFALALDLPRLFFADKLDKNISALRVICYPEQEYIPEPGQLRSGVHTDYGTLTILTSDQVAGGLQALHRDGYWVDVDIEPGTYVVNIGDVMQMVTNEKWISTLHRVVNPSADKASTSRRISIPFFHQPNYDALIETLPSCLKQGQRSKYDPVTYLEHWNQKWSATRPSSNSAM